VTEKQRESAEQEQFLTMASSRKKKTVTFEGDEDNYDEETSGDEEEIIRSRSRRLYNDDIGLSLLEEHLNETEEGNIMLSDWEDCVADGVSATVGEGSDTVLEILCEEVQFIRMAFQREFDTTQPSLSAIANLFYGPDSKIFRIFKDTLKITHVDFIKFMKTFCVQTAYRVSCTEMFDSDSYVDTTKLCTSEEYTALWQKIGRVRIPKDPKSSASSTDTFWMQLEEALNGLLRELVVEVLVGGQSDDGRKISRLWLTLDDDKMHWNGTRHHHAWLQNTRHVRDNRTGFVCHHGVLPASGLLLAIKFDRKGDTAETSSKQMIIRQFAPSHGGADRGLVPDLSFMFLSADRGYSSKGLRDFLARGGAGFNGTLARNLGNPFTYDQKMRDGDERTSIPTAGGKTMFLKKAMLHGIQFTAFAYRDGNGKVILSVSNEYHNYQWDLVLRQNADRTWHEKHQKGEIMFDDVLRRCFMALIGSAISNEMIQLLLHAPVQPLTMAQSTCAGWFFQRFLSQTSRSVAHGTAIYSGDEEELDHIASWAYVKSFVRKAGSRSYAVDDSTTGGGGEDETKINEDEKNNEDEETNNNEEKKEEATDEDEDTNLQFFLDFDDAIDLPRLLATPSDQAYITEVRKHLDNLLYSEETVSVVLSELGASLSNDQSAVRKHVKQSRKLLLWLNQHPLLRPVYFHSAAKLKAFAKSLNPVCVLDAKVAQLAAQTALANHLSENPMTTIDAATIEAQQSSVSQLTKRQKLIRSFIASGFLPKLATEQRSDTRRGLDLEEPMARELLRDSLQAKTVIEIIEIASAPLCNRMDLEIHSVNCSADFVALIRHPDKQACELAIIECKGRVKPTTAAAQKRVLDDAKLFIGRSTRDKYIIVDAMSDAFAYFVNKRDEALQLLHHAYCYDVRFVFIVFCNTHGNIIGGVWVQFSCNLKLHWGNMLHDMHKLGLSYAYRPPGEDVVQSKEEYDELEQVLKTVVVAGGALDASTYFQWLTLWRIVRLTWRPPLPPIARIIPLNLAIWNAVKGGSDTITKLLWMCKYAPPSDLPQASVTSRILLLSLTCIHRLHQVATSKLDVKNKYQSLSHFRNAANKRMSFSKTIVSTSKCNAFNLPTAGETNRSGMNRRPASPARLAAEETCITVAHAPITTKTPKRNVLKQYQRLEESEKISMVNRTVLERRKKCQGQPIYCAERGTCIVCHQDCQEYCVLCHHYCHNNLAYPGAEQEMLSIRIPGESGSEGRTFHVKNSCFWYLHKERFKEMYEQDNRQSS
jgi:hypothetical protein